MTATTSGVNRTKPLPKPPVDIVGDLLTWHESAMEQRQEDARKNIAYILVGAYLLLLLVNIGLPVALFLTSNGGSHFSLADTKDLILAISAAISSLVGVLGFVMGFYFKERETAAQKKR